ncbi:MAG TPA: hypothetical protein VJV79_28700 [Polyangiaceae bacterium]|nr:hypothetical protein [Polyangiaceae bacterium]
MNISSLVWGVPVAVLCAVACGSAQESRLDGSGSTAGSGGAAGHAAASAGSGSIDVGVGNGDAGAAGDRGVSCGGVALAAGPQQVQVLLVVDKSLSMNVTPTGFGDTKWNGLRSALRSAVDATDGNVAFGLDFFPSSGAATVPLANGCELPSSSVPTVEVGSSAATKTAIENALAENSPAGATPTAAALARALSYFTKGAGKTLLGKHYVLLATDGGPNCDDSLSCEADTCTVNMDGLCPTGTNCCDPKIDPAGPGKCLDDGATVAMVEALAKANVKTIVVGIPGTEAYGDTLDAVATAGGVQNPTAPPSYFAVSASGGVNALSQVLTNITTGLITSCSLVLENDPPDHDQINVIIDGRTIPAGAVDGWELDETSTPPTVVLKGSTCEAVSTAGASKLSITFGCPTEHVK